MSCWGVQIDQNTVGTLKLVSLSAELANETKTRYGFQLLSGNEGAGSVLETCEGKTLTIYVAALFCTSYASEQILHKGGTNKVDHLKDCTIIKTSVTMFGIFPILDPILAKLTNKWTRSRQITSASSGSSSPSQFSTIAPHTPASPSGRDQTFIVSF